MKKICKCCGRNRKNPDGKNIYCRECMRKFTNGYKCTPRGRQKQHIASKKWRKNNKDVVNEYNRRYYLANKDRIIYNYKARKNTECILITEDSKKSNNFKINKGSAVCSIEINPKRKGYGN